MFIVQQTIEHVTGVLADRRLDSSKRPSRLQSAIETRTQKILARIDSVPTRQQDANDWQNSLREFAPLRAWHQVVLGQTEKCTLMAGFVTILAIVLFRLTDLILNALMSPSSGGLDLSAGVGPFGLAVTTALFVIVMSIVLYAAWVSLWDWLSNWGISRKIALAAEFVPPALAFGVAHAGQILTPLQLHEQQYWLLRGALEGSLLVGLMYCGLLVTANIGRVAHCFITNLYKKRHASSYFQYSLFKALERISVDASSPIDWDRRDLRGTLIVDLEDAAHCLELIPERLKALDAHSADWERIAYQRRAFAIRELKKWIILPKRDTPSYFEEELRRMLKIASTGDWDSLPEAEPTAIKNASWWNRTLRITSSLTLAIIPLASILLLQSYKHTFPDQILNYLVSISVLWLVVTVLPLLDSRFAEKLSSFKELSTFIPFTPKKE